MKKYRVNVNGTVYEVELEEMTGAPAAPAAAPAAPAAAPAAGGEKVTSPMPPEIFFNLLPICLPPAAKRLPLPCPARSCPSTWPPATR